MDHSLNPHHEHMTGLHFKNHIHISDEEAKDREVM